MPRTTTDRLIINSPYEEPARRWRYDRETRTFDTGGGPPRGGLRRGSRSFDGPGIFVEIALVNQIRRRVKAWRDAGYPGVTSISKRLLEHWRDPNVGEELGTAAHRVHPAAAEVAGGAHLSGIDVGLGSRAPRRREAIL